MQLDEITETDSVLHVIERLAQRLHRFDEPPVEPTCVPVQDGLDVPVDAASFGSLFVDKESKKARKPLALRIEKIA